MDKKAIGQMQLPLFDDIQPQQTSALLACLQGCTRTYDKGEYFFLDEDPIDRVGVVLSGTVHMLKEDVWGNETLLAFIECGELFGESFALRKDNSSKVSFMAASRCEVLFLSTQKILHPCAESCVFHQRLIENMFDIIGGKNRQLMEKIEIISKGSLRDKIMAFLSMEAQQAGSPTFKISLSRTELAKYLCANRSALYRELNALEDEGVIAVKGNTFTIL